MWARPPRPSLCGATDGFYRTLGVAVSDEYVYVFDWGDDHGSPPGGRLIVFDVSAPSSPVKIGNVHTGGGFAHSVAVSGRYVYTTHSSHLSVVDANIPSSPFLVASWTYLLAGAWESRLMETSPMSRSSTVWP